MSTPADDELKALRKTAHELAADIWGPWENDTARKRMYDWLKRHTQKGHIGKMDKSEIRALIKTFKEMPHVCYDRSGCRKCEE